MNWSTINALGFDLIAVSAFNRVIQTSTISPNRAKVFTKNINKIQLASKLDQTARLKTR
jgi:hypothetical protein